MESGFEQPKIMVQHREQVQAAEAVSRLAMQDSINLQRAIVQEAERQPVVDRETEKKREAVRHLLDTTNDGIFLGYDPHTEAAIVKSPSHQRAMERFKTIQDPEKRQQERRTVALDGLVCFVKRLREYQQRESNVA